MRILFVYINGVQSYSEPTYIPLAPTKTIIKGGNDKGKSTIKKSLGLFAGIYTKDDLNGLINYNMSNAIVKLYLSNRTVLRADVNRASCIYKLLNWQEDVVLQEWRDYSQDIARYLGWITVPSEGICINLNDSNTQVFVTTSRATNAEVINAIATVPEIDQRLNNMNQALIDSKNTENWLKYRKASLKSTISYYNKSKHQVLQEATIYFKKVELQYNASSLIANIFYNFMDIKEIQLKLSQINIINLYKATKTSLQLINLYKQLHLLTKFEQSVALTTALNSTIKLRKLNNLSTELKSIKQTSDQLSPLNLISKALKKRHYLTTLESKITALNQTNTLLTALRTATKLRQLQQFLVTLDQCRVTYTFTTDLKSLKNQYILRSKMTNFQSLLTIRKILNVQLLYKTLQKLYFLDTLATFTASAGKLTNSLKELKNVQNQLEKYDFCPLCKQPLKKGEVTCSSHNQP